ncbi:MAG: hypothetical protein LBS91_04905 [Clostridiales Family XIII bacterium]|jgi:DNA modification methylase|nr:hypothetical protein [Clostridiales Family XIII bacterium]
MNETVKTKRPRKPKELENQPGKYDERNKLNDLTGKDWLLLTRSYWISETTTLDRTAYAHPAPFMIEDVKKLISMYTKLGMTVLDPFVGSGTTLIAASLLNRNSIGIDLNEQYRDLFLNRANDSKLSLGNAKYIVGDSLVCLDSVHDVDYIVTSPPYHNILRNDSKGTRSNNGKQYRMAARDGVGYYSEEPNDLGNFDEYCDFINAFSAIMKKAIACLKSSRYASIVISDFTVNKQEHPVISDIVKSMIDIGYEYCGTTVLLQTVKPLYPFGYPYAYKINHHHQSIVTFRKPIDFVML